MAIQTPTEAQRDVKERLPASQVTQPVIAKPQQEGPATGRMPASQDEHVKERPAPVSNDHLARSAAIDVGVAAVVAATLFVAGLMRSRIERVVRRLIENAEDIDVPLSLPIAVVETVREVLADRRIVAESSADRQATN